MIYYATNQSWLLVMSISPLCNGLLEYNQGGTFVDQQKTFQTSLQTRRVMLKHSNDIGAPVGPQEVCNHSPRNVTGSSKFQLPVKMSEIWF